MDRARRHAELAGVFSDPGVAAAYRYRPPYPPEVFEILDRLLVDEPRHLLDLGAGEGALARPLAERVDRVDALDVSAAMVAAGRTRPGGTRLNLRWIVGAVETAELAGPYALVTAGASLHWMSAEATMARLRQWMTPNAQVAVIEHGHESQPWRDALID